MYLHQRRGAEPFQLLAPMSSEIVTCLRREHAPPLVRNLISWYFCYAVFKVQPSSGMLRCSNIAHFSVKCSHHDKNLCNLCSQVLILGRETVLHARMESPWWCWGVLSGHFAFMPSKPRYGDPSHTQFQISLQSVTKQLVAIFLKNISSFVGSVRFKDNRAFSSTSFNISFMMDIMNRLSL